MDSQMEKFLSEYVEKALNGPGFAIYSPREKEDIRVKLMGYFSDLIFDTLIRNLTDEQVEEIQAMPDLNSQEALDKISLLSASVPGFIFIVQDRFEKEAGEIGKNGRIPDPQINPAPQA